MDYVGEWWLPDQPDIKLAGTLTYDPAPLTLALEGTFASTPRPPGEDTSYSLVYGVTMEGKPVTLFDIHVGGWRTGAGGFTRDRLLPESALIGVHGTTTLTFDEVVIELDTLHHWLGGPKPLDIRVGDPDANEPPLTVKYLQPDKVEGDLAHGSHYSFQFWPKWGVEEDDSIRLAPFVRLCITSRPLSKEALFDEYVGPIQELVTLGTNHPTKLVNIWLRSPDITWTVPNGQDVQVEVQWLGNLRTVAKPRPFSPVRVLFTVVDVQDQLSQLIDKWLILRRRAKGAFDLYFGSLFAPPTHIDTQFYLAITAAEAYHREVVRNEVLPAQEHDKMIQVILAVSPSEFRDWLQEKLAYSNEPSLRQRLRDLIDKTRIPMEALMKTRPNYVRHAVFARNFYTHRERKKGKGFSGARYYDLTRVTTLLLKACILLDLGFNETDCWSIMMHNPDYDFARMQGEPVD